MTVKKKLIISDIAKQLGISITTVSFILNGKAEEKRISKAVIEKVTKYIEELGYKPNQLAKSLRTGKTNIIGLIVENISNQFFANVARLIEENAYKNGYRIFYCSTENNTEKTKDLISMFQDRHVDGYIITPSQGIEQEIEELLKNNLPVVLFDRFLPDVPTNYVGVDNEGATYEAAQHLYEQGYQQIAFITIYSEQMQMQGRLSGYEKAVKEQGKESVVQRMEFSEDHAQTIHRIENFLRENSHIDAVIFGTNYLGIYGLEAIKGLGKQVSVDLGVIAFDDHDLFRLYSPSITAIAQPIEEMSQQLISILLSQLNLQSIHRSEGKTQLSLPTTLIVRESSKKKSTQPVNEG